MFQISVNVYSAVPDLHDNTRYALHKNNCCDDNAQVLVTEFFGVIEHRIFCLSTKIVEWRMLVLPTIKIQTLNQNCIQAINIHEGPAVSLAWLACWMAWSNSLSEISVFLSEISVTLSEISKSLWQKCVHYLEWDTISLQSEIWNFCQRLWKFY